MLFARPASAVIVLEVPPCLCAHCLITCITEALKALAIKDIQGALSTVEAALAIQPHLQAPYASVASSVTHIVQVAIVLRRALQDGRWRRGWQGDDRTGAGRHLRCDTPAALARVR